MTHRIRRREFLAAGAAAPPGLLAAIAAAHPGRGAVAFRRLPRRRSRKRTKTGSFRVGVRFLVARGGTGADGGLGLRGREERSESGEVARERASQHDHEGT